MSKIETMRRALSYVLEYLETPDHIELKKSFRVKWDKAVKKAVINIVKTALSEKAVKK